MIVIPSDIRSTSCFSRDIFIAVWRWCGFEGPSRVVINSLGEYYCFLCFCAWFVFCRVITGHPPCSVWSREDVDGIVPKIAYAINTFSRDVYNLPREKEKERVMNQEQDVRYQWNYPYTVALIKPNCAHQAVTVVLTILQDMMLPGIKANRG